MKRKRESNPTELSQDEVKALFLAAMKDQKTNCPCCAKQGVEVEMQLVKQGEILCPECHLNVNTKPVRLQDVFTPETFDDDKLAARCAAVVYEVARTKLQHDWENMTDWRIFSRSNTTRHIADALIAGVDQLLTSIKEGQAKGRWLWQ